MTGLRAIVSVTVLFLAATLSLSAQTNSEWIIDSPEGGISYSPATGLITATNGVVIKYQGRVLTAQRVILDQATGDANAEGHVRIQQEDMTWTGEHIEYNFKTHQMVADRFRAGRSPVFAEGLGLHGSTTNRFYDATNALVTTDDISNPLVKVRARHIRIVPGQYFEATHAVLFFGDVPVFYFPYYRRNLGQHANNLNFVPGYRGVFGPFLLTDYTWYLNDELDGVAHLDYREKRGLGAGPDFNFHFGRWGSGDLRYYYLRDEDAGTNLASLQIPESRQRVYFGYQADPLTNVSVKALVRYQSDSDVLKDFFQGEYEQNPQPNSYVEANKFWDNFSLDALAQPRVNDFLETVERLPDVRLTGFQQQIGESPLFYDSQSSVGYYKRLFAGTNSPFASHTNAFFGPPNAIPPNFSAARADTYHEITLPETLFGWLNITPRVGGRLTYYSAVDVEGMGTTFRTNSDTYREVFNTGAEVSFKASRLWPSLESKTLDLDGLRHIVEPSVNYVYVPRPNYAPDQLPQFDYELPSLRPLPIEYPEYNSIDSIDSQNVMRFGLENKLQTKREGRVEDFLDWNALLDWRLRPGAGQSTFADLYSNFTLRPRSWIILQSETRYDINGGDWHMLLHTLTFQPNDTWSWAVGHFYLKDDFSGLPTAIGQGNNLITSTLFYRLNENWGVRASHNFDARDGRLAQQYYTIYHDMRSWTAALTAGVIDNGYGPKDFSIAFTFSIKAKPKYGLRSDSGRPFALLGAE